MSPSEIYIAANYYGEIEAVFTDEIQCLAYLMLQDFNNDKHLMYEDSLYDSNYYYNNGLILRCELNEETYVDKLKREIEKAIEEDKAEGWISKKDHKKIHENLKRLESLYD